MAQRSTVHRVQIELADTDRQVYEMLQMSVARADSETELRLVARLIAYCLCYEPDIAFTGGVGAGDEPDVWVRQPDGRIKAWIEVGLPDSARLAKAARHCSQVIVFAYGRGLSRWENDHLPALRELKNVSVSVLEMSFLDQLVARVDRTIAWTLTVSGGTLYLTVDGSLLEATPRHLSSPRSDP
jgi:uncharacterized protein YaeQ